MKQIKMFAVPVIVVVMLFASVFTSLAAKYPLGNLHYVALGDSIAFGGSGLPDDQWVEDSYADLLAKQPKVSEYHNLSTPGITSVDLLSQLSALTPDDKMAKQLMRADVISISIGGNNLLGPLYSYLYDPSYQGNLGQDLYNGALQFAHDWPLILEAIKKLNPTAKIAVNTVYNPYQAMPNDEFGTNAIWALGNTFLPMLNASIQDPLATAYYNYKPIDVYSAFEGNAYSQDLTFSYHFENSDPHPTVAGQQLIYQMHKAYFDTLLK